MLPTTVSLPPPTASPLRWWVCLLLMQATIINYMDRMTLNQLAVEIKASLHLDDVQYSALESIFSFAFAIGAVGTGFLVDRISVRWVYPLAVLGWSLAGMLTGFADSFGMLLACRFALGIFEAANWPCGIRTTRAVLKPEERSFGNSLFQSGTALGAVMTPLVVLGIVKWAEAYGFSDTWRIPFRIIGAVGLVWIALWFFTIPARMVQTVPPADASTDTASSGRFSAVLADRRFWALFVAVIAINITWHGYRTWLPLFLRQQRGYSLEAMSAFTTFYYLLADIGSWTIGLLTLGMCRRGVELHTSRLIAFFTCAVLTLGTVSVPFLPNNWILQAGLLAVAFGALGLFPTYFALSQELSGKHQGKVTGTLGACAHISLAIIYPLEGWVCQATQSYAGVLGGVGVFPLLALGVLLWLWPRSHTASPQS
ncbi:MAG: MFS transporter [Gemmataceae bacterium]|nr:MFS transporter [Gemmata sp.]MDW8197176.1 MFS transporter [Gemmataceae bacterium]